MAASFKLGPDPKLSTAVLRRITVTGDASYPTGGYAVTAANCGVDEIYAVIPAGGFDGYVAEFDYTNSKLKFYWTGAGLSGVFAQVTNATNLSAVSGDIIVFGRKDQN